MIQTLQKLERCRGLRRREGGKGGAGGGPRGGLEEGGGGGTEENEASVGGENFLWLVSVKLNCVYPQHDLGNI